ncbi:hypothetical protein [Geobacter sp.]|uniref:hypothetical protein n=1 Tax=Geobacter sp. TaxID=46610 RepID=UPI00263230E3|nr:hypothetical protein [Geobacter sp.]
MKTLRVLTVILVLTGFGCSGGGGGSAPSNTPAAVVKTGKFIDSPVEGLAYKTASLSGTTDKEGTFQYREGEDVSFSVGDVALGSVKGKEKVTPVDLVSGAVDERNPVVTNIAALLLSLDQDGKPNNGISITPNITQKITGAAVDLNLDPNEFTKDRKLMELFVSLNKSGVFAENGSKNVRVPCDPIKAQQHLNASLNNTTLPDDLGNSLSPPDINGIYFARLSLNSDCLAQPITKNYLAAVQQKDDAVSMRLFVPTNPPVIHASIDCTRLLNGCYFTEIEEQTSGTIIKKLPGSLTADSTSRIDGIEKYEISNAQKICKAEITYGLQMLQINDNTPSVPVPSIPPPSTGSFSSNNNFSSASTSNTSSDKGVCITQDSYAPYAIYSCCPDETYDLCSSTGRMLRFEPNKNISYCKSQGFIEDCGACCYK